MLFTSDRQLCSTLDRLIAMLPDRRKIYTALAPMQDVTDLGFMKTIASYGCPDYFFTEFLRVHETSRLDKYILRSIVENDTGKPIFAQLLGESIPDLIRIANLLTAYPIAGIDLNLGCPAPKVYRKNVGGGLLRDPDRVDRILGELRNNISGKFTVKMRIGFDDTANFDRLLALIDRHQIDLLSLHGRTVKEMYHGDVHYDLIAHAVDRLSCPVFANGNVTSAAMALKVIDFTKAAGVTIGRSAIRNPWIFTQIHQALVGEKVMVITLKDVRDYIDRLHRMETKGVVQSRVKISRLKMYLNYIGQSVDPEGIFLYDIRRAQTEAELFAICDRQLLTNPDLPFAPDPYPGLFARPKSCA